MKRFFTVLTAFVLAFSPLRITYASIPIRVTIDGNEVIFVDQSPVIVDGHILLPARAVFEYLGFDVNWDAGTQRVTFNRGDVIVLTIGSNILTINGIVYVLDMHTQIIDGRMMLPVRPVFESLGYMLDWDASMHTIGITAGLSDDAAALTPNHRWQTVPGWRWPVSAVDLRESCKDYYKPFGRLAGPRNIENRGRRHLAVDLGTRHGAPVFSPADGSVVRVGPAYNTDERVVVIQHTLPSGERVYSFFDHLLNDIHLIEKNVEVSAGQRIGTGNTHVHFAFADRPGIVGSLFGWGVFDGSEEPLISSVNRTGSGRGCNVVFFNPEYVLRTGRLPAVESSFTTSTRQPNP